METSSRLLDGVVLSPETDRRELHHCKKKPIAVKNEQNNAIENEQNNFLSLLLKITNIILKF